MIRSGTGQSSSIPESIQDSSGIRRVLEPVPGLLAGRHRGFEVTAGDIVMYLDDDVRLAEGWFEAILEPFQDSDVHLVGCRYLPDYETEPPGWLNDLWTQDENGRHLTYLSLFDAGDAASEIDPLWIWGLCYAIRRSTLVRLGGFHPDSYPWELRRFRGDGETALSSRAREQKLKCVYQGRTAVFHHVPKSRMTKEYFEQRAYLQGISDSFTQIRRDGSPSRPSHWQQARSRLKSTVKGYLNRTQMTLSSALHAAYCRGYEYHQNEVLRDSALFDWVMRKEYWNYALPVGAEKHLSPANQW